ncbi:MAG: hypothetical protein UZ17_ACD001000438 [Acidobacteria bacterium OLB17]|nr:MAG: hypothetical protein UZ17_ACD001000438 [Acidobacteria bacterium OLB17]
MKRSIRNPWLVVVAILGATMLAYPFLPSEAQKVSQSVEKPTPTTMANSTPSPTPKPETLIQELRKNPIASDFYDSISAEEKDMVLIKAVCFSNSARLLFTNENAEIRVNIYLAESLERAKGVFDIKIAMGVLIPCKGNECADQGQKGYSGTNALKPYQYVGFQSLTFRKGLYIVSIYCESEDTAKRLAGYAIDALAKNGSQNLFSN